MRMTGCDVCYCSYTPILQHIRYFEVKNQDFPYSTFVNVNNNIRENSEKGVRIMKKSYTVIRFLVVLMMIAAFVACASTPKQESTGEYVDDSVITAKIKTQLATDDFLKSFQIRVESRKGIVQLSGFVNSQDAVDKAGKIAGGVEGVKSVKNDLIVK